MPAIRAPSRRGTCAPTWSSCRCFIRSPPNCRNAAPAIATRIRDFYDGAAAEIAAHLDAGRVVAVICEGDPLFYGSYMHLHARLAPRFATEIVAGVTGMSGCWSAAGTADRAGRRRVHRAAGDAAGSRTGAPARRRRRRGGDEGRAASAKLRRALDRSGRLARAIYVERGTMADAKMIAAQRKARRRGAVFRRRAGAGLGGTAMTGRLAVIGLGPGDPRYLTPEAEAALAGAEALYGYGPYLDRVPARAWTKPPCLRQSRGARARRRRAASRRAGRARRDGVRRRSRRVRHGGRGLRGDRGRAGCVARARRRRRARHHRDARGRGADRRAARP